MAQITEADSRSTDRQGNPVFGDQSDAIVIVAATSSAAPAGGSGIAAGGWSSSGDRDLAIATINALRTDVAALIVAVNSLRLSNQAQGFDAGSS